MKRTNRHAIPETILRAIEKTEASYDAGQVDTSVTSLIQPARITHLRKKHFKELERDISEEIFALLGSGVHHLLELGATPDMVVEERLFINIDGWAISGAIDVQQVRDNKINITDYKVTSVYSVSGDEPKIEWQQQLNMHRILVEANKDMKVGKLTICAILRDWSSSTAIRDPNYPQSPIIQIDIPIWDEDITLAYMRERIAAHRAARYADEFGDELAECTPEERWVRGDKWSVIKIGGKRATQTFTNEYDATTLLQEKGEGYEIRHQPGKSVRCQYCGVSQFCSQFQAMHKDNEDDDHSVQAEIQ